MMADPHSCPECGQGLPTDAPGGLCPRCLMGAAVSAVEAPAPPGWPLDLEEFRLAVLDMGLMPADDLESYAAAASVDVSGLARALVRARKLTPYQAGALCQGKGKGLVIGRYVILEKRGQGGMGIVFKARDRRDGRIVALKMLPPSFGRDRDAVRRFRREFDLAARLNHPNVVSAIDADEDRGVQFLTMEFIDGHDLDALVASVGPLPVKLAVHCALQAARGLEAAHAKGIVHRDIKPGNIMLDATGGVRVLDLGLARVIEASSPFGRAPGGSLTVSGAYMGTVDFVAPEQADDSKSASHLADVYALGCTLYFLLTGRPPFEGETILKKLIAHQDRPAPSLLAARPDVPRALEEVYQAMMAKRPGDRPASMTEVIARLEACRASSEEAKDARATLRGFAETILKRAAPRPRDRGPDASIFAKPARPLLTFDPDLRFEDLVPDLRDDPRLDPIAEAKLPPKPPRTRDPRRPPPVIPWAMAFVVACVLLYVFWPRGRGVRSGGAIAGADVAPRPIGRPSAPPAPSARATPLLDDGLSGWVADRGTLGSWTLAGGVLSASARTTERTRLLTRQEYGDFTLKLRFRVEEDAIGLVVLETREGGTPRTVGVQVGGRLPSKETGGFWAGTGGALGTFQDPYEPARKAPDGEWSAMEITRRAGRIDLTINGRRVNHPHEPPPIPGACRIGFEVRAGALRVRDVELQTLPPAPPGPRTIYEDDFDEPWLGKSDNYTQGNEVGMYYFHARNPGMWGWDCPPYRLPDSVDVEAVGRVVPDNPTSKGSWALQAIYDDGGKERGLDVRIDGDGQLWVGPSFWTAEAFPDDTLRRGPISHPAIRRGDQFNTLGLRLRPGRVEIRVNGVLVVDPLVVGWARDLDTIRKGVFCHQGAIRAEFDRVIVNEMPGGEASAAPTPPDATLGKVIYADEFADPSSGWTRGVLDMGTRDYGGGFYTFAAQPGWEGTSCSEQATAMLAHDFQVEVVGRVTGDDPKAIGGWGVIIGREGDNRGIDVQIDRAGALRMLPSFWGGEKYAGDERIGPVTHRAIHPGDQLNRLTVRVRKRRVEILVNGTPVCEPVTLAWDLSPATPMLIVNKPENETRIRVDFDRIEVRELLP